MGNDALAAAPTPLPSSAAPSVAARIAVHLRLPIAWRRRISGKGEGDGVGERIALGEGVKELARRGTRGDGARQRDAQLARGDRDDAHLGGRGSALAHEGGHLTVAEQTVSQGGAVSHDGRPGGGVADEVRALED